MEQAAHERCEVSVAPHLQDATLVDHRTDEHHQLIPVDRWRLLDEYVLPRTQSARGELRVRMMVRDDEDAVGRVVVQDRRGNRRTELESVQVGDEARPSRLQIDDPAKSNVGLAEHVFDQ